MKKKLTKLVLVSLILANWFNTSAQTTLKTTETSGVKTFSAFSFTKISGENYIDLSIYILDNSINNTTLGISSFVIQYDSNSLSYQPGPMARVPLDKGYFSNGLKSYLDPITVPYGSHCHSIETDCNDSVAIIPDTATLVGTMRFKIINPIGLAGFSWKKDFSAVFDGNRHQIKDIKYIEPDPISLLDMDMDFHAVLADNKVLLLNKLTQSEWAEKGAEVQKSRDGINFENFEAIPKSGNSAQDLEYSAYDEHPYPGTSFYRIISKKKSGKYEVLDMLVIHRPLEK